MGITYDKLTALAIIRRRRAARAGLGARVSLAEPQLAEGRRWTRRAVSPERYAGEPGTERVYVAVPTAASRIRTRGVVSTVYSRGLPEGAFRRLGQDDAVASPELLFVELGTLMPLPVQVMVGMELCGTFSRDAADPRLGEVAFDLEPVTSVERLRTFVRTASRIDGLGQAREAVGYVADNAWSPMEATIATMAALPVEQLGYGLGPVELNRRVEAPSELEAVGAKASRVPDVLIAGSRVGLNYDGKAHFDLDGLASAAAEGASDADARVRSLRGKLVDDVRRTRELAAAGYVVLPATSEDLFEEGAFDALMLEVMCAIERFEEGRDLSSQRRAVASKGLRPARQRLLWSLLPWSEASEHAREIIARERVAMSSMGAVEEGVVGPEDFTDAPDHAD